MTYTKIKITNEGDEELYRVILVKENLELFELASAIVYFLGGDISHFTMILDNDKKYVKASYFTNKNDKNHLYIADYHLTDLSSEFVLVYDDKMSFKCQILEDKIEIEDEREFVLTDGKGKEITKSEEVNNNNIDIDVKSINDDFTKNFKSLYDGVVKDEATYIIDNDLNVKDMLDETILSKIYFAYLTQKSSVYNRYILNEIKNDNTKQKMIDEAKEKLIKVKVNNVDDVIDKIISSSTFFIVFMGDECTFTRFEIEFYKRVNNVIYNK